MESTRINVGWPTASKSYWSETLALYLGEPGSRSQLKAPSVGASSVSFASMYEPPKSGLSESVTARLAANSRPFLRAEPRLASYVRQRQADATGAAVRNGTPSRSHRKTCTTPT